MNLPSVVMLGAGNVATHLAPAIEKFGAGRVVQVWSRTIGSASRLSCLLHGASPTDDIESLRTDADIYIISLVDSAVPWLIKCLGRRRGLWLHTSGSLPLDILTPLSDSIGVFYPLQTFSRDVCLDMSAIPLFVEGCDERTCARISAFGANIFRNIYYADSDMRRHLHVAAVFACNFVNHMWAIATDILNEDGLDLHVLEPLIYETARKAFITHPAKVQTGPAIRNDINVMNRHREMLSEQLSEIYTLLSGSIYRRNDDEQNRL